jgi:hypothetical protein
LVVEEACLLWLLFDLKLFLRVVEEAYLSGSSLTYNSSSWL